MQRSDLCSAGGCVVALVCCVDFAAVQQALLCSCCLCLPSALPLSLCPTLPPTAFGCGVQVSFLNYSKKAKQKSNLAAWLLFCLSNPALPHLVWSILTCLCPLALLSHYCSKARLQCHSLAQTHFCQCEVIRWHFIVLVGERAADIFFKLPQETNGSINSLDSTM